MNPVETFIYQLNDKEREIASFFHGLLVNKFQLTPALKWRIPTYGKHSLVCYLNPDNKQAVQVGQAGLHLCFMRGNQIKDTSGILETKGRKMVKSYFINNLENLPLEAIENCIVEAIQIDHDHYSRPKNHNKFL